MKWFGAGRAAMACGGRWWLCLLRNKKDYPDLRMGVVEIQFGPVRSYMGYCGAVMINKHSPRREQALDFIRYMTGQEYNELINHQADGLGPIKKFTATEKFLHDPEFPEEDSNDVWRQVMAFGAPQEDCEFINGAVAQRIVSEQLDLVRANQKSAAEGMCSAARQINTEIEKTLARNPRLRERYEQLRSGKEADR
jgi:ABC-type glycerol-3-phosphate transport system substrate-binding protein